MLGAIGVFIIEREFAQGRGLRAGRRGADLLRLHARRGGRLRRRLRRHAGGALSYAAVAAFLFAVSKQPVMFEKRAADAPKNVGMAPAGDNRLSAHIGAMREAGLTGA